MVKDLIRRPAALTLTVVNVAVWVLLASDAALEQTLGLTGGWDGVLDRPWTPLTVLFTSGHPLHLLAAVGVLLYLGAEVERIAGPTHLVLVYLLAGLVGSAAFVLLATPTGFDGTALGASAAFLGVLGALAAAPPTARSERLDLRKILVAILLVNLSTPVLGIAEWVSSIAHLAGIAIGAAFMLVRGRRAPEVLNPGSSRLATAGPR